jgi:TolB-like protein/KaiC/GvpD/RAD55 family RecA-like ATPase/Flp pilus assembly protein TadD
MDLSPDFTTCLLDLFSTGLPALDERLDGGYPDKSVVLIIGTGGTGKERLGYRFIDVGLTKGDFCLYATRLSGRDARLEGIASGLTTERMPSWIASEGGEAKIDMNDLAALSFNIKGLLNKNRGRRMRIVLDFLSPSLILNQPETVYRFLNQLFSETKQHDAVLLGLLEPGMHKPEVVATMEDLFDGVIVLSPKTSSPEAMPLISVKKMRGVSLHTASGGSFEWGGPTTESIPKGLDRRRIAVLPFRNISPDPNDEYFADGITEELITALSGIEQLSVISSTSVMKYKTGAKSVTDIARELTAGSLVEGHVRKAADRVRITVQLTDGRDERNLWAQTYDRQLNDIFAVQSEIAESVVEALKVRLLESERRSLRKTPTSSSEAYTLYLKGRYHSNKGGRESFEEAIRYFEMSIQQDTAFALGYAGLAANYQVMGGTGYSPPETAYPKALGFALKALELDADLGEAHAVLGIVLLHYEHDPRHAEEELKRAIAQNPSDSTAHAYYCALLAYEGHFSEAQAEMLKAVELDPLSASLRQWLGQTFYFQRMYDEAIEQYETALRMSPTNPGPYVWLMRAHVRKSMYDEALEAVEDSYQLTHQFLQKELWTAYVYAGMGKESESRRLLDEVEGRFSEEILSPYVVALTCFSLKDNDAGFKWLERAYSDHDPNLMRMGVDMDLEPARSDPRYAQLLDRVGLGRK